jgi:hypothetical protein
MFVVRLGASALLISLMAIAVTAAAPAHDNAKNCPSAVATIRAADASRVSRECALTDVTITAGDVSVAAPDAGEGVGAYALKADGSGVVLEVERSVDGTLTAVVNPDHVHEPEDVEAAEQELAEMVTAAAATSARCQVTSRSETSHKWIPANARFYLNDNERMPSNISVTSWRSIVNLSQGVWEKATNSCGLHDASSLELSLSVDTSRDAGITSANTCTGKDGWNVIEFGPLSGTTLGLTCSYWTNNSNTKKPMTEADIRLDNSSRSWVTSTSNCSGTKYDLRSVVTHELGHAVGLGHAVAGKGQTMNPTTSACSSINRTLGSGDWRSVDVQY